MIRPPVRVSPLFLLLLLIVSPSWGEDHPLLSSIGTIYGGAERGASVASIELSGTITDRLPVREGPFRMIATKGKRMRMEMFVTLSSSGEVRIIGSEKGWKNDRTAFVPLSPAETRELSPEWFVFFFPLSLLDGKGTISYDDTVIRGGRPLELYRVRRPDMPEITIFSDPVSRLVTTIQWHDSHDAHISWNLGEFRFVEGILFPFTFTRRVDDIVVQTVTITGITLNRTPPPGTFSP